MIVLFLSYLLSSTFKGMNQISGYLKSEYSWCELNSHMCTLTHNHMYITSLWNNMRISIQLILKWSTKIFSDD